LYALERLVQILARAVRFPLGATHASIEFTPHEDVGELIHKRGGMRIVAAHLAEDIQEPRLFVAGIRD
jgi:hypothetical protein